MSAFTEAISNALSSLDVFGLLDILIIAGILYYLLVLLRGTTAISLLRGVAIILLLGFVLSNVLQLSVLSWLFRHSFTAMLVAIPIVFQPELRRALERIGRTGLRPWTVSSSLAQTVEAVSRAAIALSEHHHGALIVLERETGLQDYIDTGMALDAVLSVELIQAIFEPTSPLHDQAVIVREGRIAAARCVLPLSQSYGAASRFGTRHRAGIGITEGTDAVVVIVSQETGSVSVTHRGEIVRVGHGNLRTVLAGLCGLEQQRPLVFARGG